MKTDGVPVGRMRQGVAVQMECVAQQMKGVVVQVKKKEHVALKWLGVAVQAVPKV